MNKIKFAIAIMLIFKNHTSLAYSDMEFDNSLLFYSDGEKSKGINLKYFSQDGGGVLPGSYKVDIIINDEDITSEDITFKESKNKSGEVYPYITQEMLSSWGVDISLLGKRQNSDDYEKIESIIPDARVNFDHKKMRLVISIPQIYLKQPGIYNTIPEKWNEGINSILLNYDYNTNNQKNSNKYYTSSFIGINSGVNINAWRFRQDFSWNKNSHGKQQFKTLNTYLQKDYSILQGGELTLGQANSDGVIFDSFPLSGLQLTSNDSMLAPYMTSYSPVIRGIASSPSIVTVKQNNNVIFQKNVETGPFEFNDIPQAISGSDLKVEIRGADGKVQTYNQVAASVPMLLRKGRVRYSLAVGKYRADDKSIERESPILQTTLGWGFGKETLYGGFQISKDYNSQLLGIAKYFDSLGAISFDITQASSKMLGKYGKLDNKKGKSLRINYARNFEQTETNVNITGVKYNSRDFYNFSEAQNLIKINHFNSSHIKSRISISISQNLKSFGSLTLSGSQDSYWGNSLLGHNYQVGYNLLIGSVFVNLAAGTSKSIYSNKTDKSISLMLSIPLNNGDNSANYMMTNSFGKTQNQIGISGSMLENNNMSYSLYGSKGSDQYHSYGINTNYHGSMGDIDGSYNSTQNSRQISVSGRGGLLISKYGIAMSTPLSFSGGNALIRTPDVEGVQFNGSSYAKTNRFGLGVVTNLMPYSKNIISLDVNSIPDNADIISADKFVIPTKGAVVLSQYKTSIGNKALINISLNNKAIPFGSIVTLKNNDNIQTGITSENGQVYLAGLPMEGVLNVSWGRTAEKRCFAKYSLPESSSPIKVINAICYQ
ncbi:TPA: fimbria/pilus outer membrane usher protein [Citrobacter freundii]